MVLIMCSYLEQCVCIFHYVMCSHIALLLLNAMCLYNVFKYYRMCMYNVFICNFGGTMLPQDASILQSVCLSNSTISPSTMLPSKHLYTSTMELSPSHILPGNHCTYMYVSVFSLIISCNILALFTHLNCTKSFSFNCRAAFNLVGEIKRIPPSPTSPTITCAMWRIHTTLSHISHWQLRVEVTCPMWRANPTLPPVSHQQLRVIVTCAMR